MDVGTALSLALQMLPGPEWVAHRPPPIGSAAVSRGRVLQ